MILFHVTPSANVSSIMEKGLIPGGNDNGLCRNPGETWAWRLGYVWVTDDPYYILNEQAGKDWIDRYDLQILTLNIPDDEINDSNYIKSVDPQWGPDYYQSDNKFRHEFVIPEKISSNSIVNISHVEKDRLSDF